MRTSAGFADFEISEEQRLGAKIGSKGVWAIAPLQISHHASASYSSAFAEGLHWYN